MASKITARRGFTLIELTLAITFISILLLAILYVTIQAGKLYTKGVTYKNVNQVSREVIDTMRRDFMGARADSIVITTPTPDPSAGGSATHANSGRVCTGQVSYVWNTAALLQDTASTHLIKDDNMTVVFRRVLDAGGTLCQKDASTGKYPQLTGMKSTEIMKSDGRDLAAYKFSVTEISKSGSRGLYRVSMMLGTNEPSTTTYDSATGVYTCLPPSDNTASFEYCTVIEFDTIMRAGGNA